MNEAKFREWAQSRDWWSLLLWSLAVFLTVAGSKFALIAHFGVNIPFGDQWDGEGQATYLPWLEDRFGFSDLFRAHNEHRIVLSRIWSLLLLESNGLWDPLLQMIANAVLLASTATVLFLCLSGIDKRSNALLAGGVAWLCSVPLNWENTLWGFQSNFYLLTLFSIAAIWTFTTHPWGTIRWWIGWIFLAFACFSLGSGFFAAIATCGVAVLQVSLSPKEVLGRRFAIAFASLVAAVALCFLLLAPKGSGGSLQPLGSAMGNFLGMLAWPLSGATWAFLIVQAPAIGATILLVIRRRPFPAKVATLLGLVLWTFLQGGAISLTRDIGGSRYWDMFVVGLASNLALLVWLTRQLTSPLLKHLFPIACSCWCLTLSVATVFDFIHYQLPTLHHLNEVRSHHATQLKGYLISEAPDYLNPATRQVMPLHSNMEALKTLLDTPALRQILPPEFQPTLSISGTEEEGVFAESNRPREIEPPPQSPSWGSYDPINKEAAQGTLQLTFEPSPRTRWIEFFVAGQPSPHGSSLIVSALDGSHRTPISFARSPGMAWESVIVKVPEGKIRLEACDKFDQRWFAFTAPRPVGRWEAMKRRVLQQGGWHWLIAGVGLMALLGLQACFGRLLPLVAGPGQEQPAGAAL